MQRKPLNIAFEISPFLTASGTFGDKSGVYRYMYGLLSAYLKLIKKESPSSKIILFSFNHSLVKSSVSPDIFRFIDNKNVFFLNTEPELNYPIRGVDFFLQNLLGVKSNIILKLLNKILFAKYLIEYLIDRVRLRAYLNFLENEFIRYKVKVVFHSETGFFQLSKTFKNVAIMYDLTPVLFSEFHRIETKDLKKRQMRFVEETCDGVISISKSTRKDLVNFSKKIKNKKHIIGYPGLDSVFKSAAKNQNQSRTISELNLILRNYSNSVKSKKYLLLYGTFEPRKNIPSLVRAFAELQTEKKIPQDFKLLLCGGDGWGKVKKHVIDYVKENFPIHEKNNIIVIDYLNDEYLIKFIKRAYATIYPSLYEGFGLPVLESMALGIPVVCSNTSSLSEAGGEAALYFDPQNFFELKDKIGYLINHSKVASEMSKKGIIQSKKFDWDKTAHEVYKFLKSL